jgi:hypothetical protein
VFDTRLDCEFEDADAPVGFGFLANCEAVEVYKDVGYGFESGAEVGF